VSDNKETQPMSTTRQATTLLCCGILALCAADRAAAVPIQFEPSVSEVGLGDVFSIDVLVSGLAGEIVSAYDLDVLYRSDVIAATAVEFTPLLGDELLFEAFNDFDVSMPGVVDFAQVSLLPDADLLALQGGSGFTLATILFEAVGLGVSPLDFVLDPVNDVKGLAGAILPVEAGSAAVTVSPVSVPEPATLWLLLGSLSALWWERGRPRLRTIS
jgi:hypothetical protein